MVGPIALGVSPFALNMELATVAKNHDRETAVPWQGGLEGACGSPAEEVSRMIPGYKFTLEVYESFTRHNCSRMAAALAYYMLFSLAPLIALLLMTVGLFYDPANVHGELNEQLSVLLTAAGAQQVQAMAANVNHHPASFWGSVAGITMLVYGASCGLSELQSALNTVWDVGPGDKQPAPRSFWLKRLISIGMIIVLALLLIASILFSAFIAAVGERLHQSFPAAASQLALQTMQNGSAFAIMTILFALLYKILPDAHVRWRDVWLGALLTGVLFTLGKFGLEQYLARRDLSTIYGAAGTFVGVLLWTNYAALIFLLGAEWTQVWSRRRRVSRA